MGTHEFVEDRRRPCSGTHCRCRLRDSCWQLHHGTLNAVCMPAVLEYNRAHVGDKYATIVEAMGLPAGTDLVAAMVDLNRRLGMPGAHPARGAYTLTRCVRPASSSVRSAHGFGNLLQRIWRRWGWKATGLKS